MSAAPRLPGFDDLYAAIIALPEGSTGEILSPSTARDDRRPKLPLYASAGVAWCWLADPEQRLVEVYETVNGRPTPTVTGTPGDDIALPPFDGVSVGEWFLPPPSAEPPP